MSRSETDQLVDEIEQIRLRLADTVDELVDRTNPKNVARRGVAGLKAKFVDEQGSVRLETVVPLVVGTAAVVAAIVGIRRLTR
ncbi:hypothetical protein ASD11_03095 [Aeromicrobium sp. Root495]|uniref:DUF3618 domain-containing protein n=1 Tax=Aeromicrobium sp. Root495 TaxID=1736550 RepID=UPI0006F8D577|nr:DUF3618 domain-containing protein [Aeromicrobium sp. Root495]KQY58655.1 hypothetical protein ASD11_03095 [Aeromicrobium sp. Root495]